MNPIPIAATGRTADAALAATDRAAIAVYYDASCPLCRSEMDALVAADTEHRIELRDCSPPGFDDPHVRAAGISRDALMDALHVRDERGAWHVGVDGFVVAYRAAGIETMARFWGNPLLKPLWVRLYPWIARNRQPLSKLGLGRAFEFLVRRAAFRAVERRCSENSCGVSKR